MVIINVDDDKKYLAPASFEECSVYQIATYVKEFLLKRSDLYSEEKDGSYQIKNHELYLQSLMRLLHATIGCSWGFFLKISPEQKNDLLQHYKLLSFYFEEKIPRNPVKKVRIGTKFLFGPVDEYKINAEEFSFVDQVYINYFKSQRPEILNTFIAILFRSRDWLYRIKKAFPSFTGDLRIGFSKHTIEDRLKLAELIPIDHKLAVWFWYHSYRSTLPEKYEYVFTPSNESKASSSGWLEVIFGMAENATFGNYKETCLTQHHLFLADQNRRIKNIKSATDAK